MSVKQSNFYKGQRVIVTQVSYDDRRQGLYGDTVAHVVGVYDGISLMIQPITSNYHYAVTNDQIRPF